MFCTLRKFCVDDKNAAAPPFALVIRGGNTENLYFLNVAAHMDVSH